MESEHFFCVCVCVGVCSSTNYCKRERIFWPTFTGHAHQVDPRIPANDCRTYTAPSTFTDSSRSFGRPPQHVSGPHPPSCPSPPPYLSTTTNTTSSPSSCYLLSVPLRLLRTHPHLVHHHGAVKCQNARPSPHLSLQTPTGTTGMRTPSVA